MCGFLYINNFDEKYNNEVMKKYSQFSQSRGPDDTNILRKEKEIFIFSRLAISSYGTHVTQPIEENGTVMMFNGEIYDYPKRFGTDTEFLYDLLNKKSGEVLCDLKRYKGFFALLFREGSKLHLCRDFLGKKPLYYGYTYFNNSFFACSSLEVAIYLSGIGQKEFDKISKRMSKRLYYTLVNSSNCKFSEVKPGESLTVDLETDIVSRRRYSIFEYIKQHDTDSTLEYKIKAAIELRHEPKVNTTLALSGGIDSGLIASFSRNFIDEVFFVDTGDILEKSRVDIAAKCCDYKVKSLPLVGESDKSDYLISHLNNFMLHNLAKNAKSSNRVILVGEGADELFLGYGRSSLLKKIPFIDTLRYILNSKFLSYIYASLYFSTVSFPFLLKYSDFKDAFTLYEDFKKVYSRCNNILDFTRILEITLHQRPLIDRVDTCFTNNGIEARAVYLDPTIISYALKSDDIGKSELKNLYLSKFSSVNDISKQGLSLEKSKGIIKKIKEKARVKNINMKVFSKVGLGNG